MKGLTKGRTIIILSCLIIIALIYTFVSFNSGRVVCDDITYISDGWEKETEENSDGSDYFRSGNKYYRLTMSHEITDDMQGRVITLKTYDSFVDAYIGDQKLDIDGSSKIYHFGEKMKLCDSPGTYFNFISIPKTDEPYITLRIETAYKNKFVTDYDIAVGERNELIFDQLHKERPMSIPNLTMLIFGVFLLVISFVASLKKINSDEIMNLAFVSIVFSIYANCPLYISQHLIQNAVAQYYLNYFSLFLLPLFILTYLENIVPKLKCGYLFCIVTLVEIILSILHFTGIASYTRTIKIYIFALGIVSVFLIICIAKYFKLISRANRIAILTLLSFVFVNVLFFMFVSTLGNHSFIARTGFLIYLVFAIYNGLKRIMNSMYQERESRLLKKIAYTDSLTGLGNRYSLERDLKKIGLEKISVFSLDLNFLKKINDTYGHAGGDILIKAAADCINSVFEKAYRMGGDEFIAVVCNSDKEKLDELQLKLKERINEINADRKSFAEFAENEQFNLSIAAGYASFAEGDTRYEQIMKRADEAMYKDKGKMHRR